MGTEIRGWQPQDKGEAGRGKEEKPRLALVDSMVISNQVDTKT